MFKFALTRNRDKQEELERLELVEENFCFTPTRPSEASTAMSCEKLCGHRNEVLAVKHRRQLESEAFSSKFYY